MCFPLGNLLGMQIQCGWELTSTCGGGWLHSRTCWPALNNYGFSSVECSKTFCPQTIGQSNWESVGSFGLPAHRAQGGPSAFKLQPRGLYHWKCVDLRPFYYNNILVWLLYNKVSSATRSTLVNNMAAVAVAVYGRKVSGWVESRIRLDKTKRE